MSYGHQKIKKMTFSRAKSFRQKSKSIKSRLPLSKSALNLHMFETNVPVLQLRPKSESVPSKAVRATKVDENKIKKYLKKFKVRKMLKSISKIKITESKTQIMGKRESIVSTSGSSIVIWEELYETLRRQP